MPRKALVPARAALRFAHQAAGKCGAAQPLRRWNQTLAVAGGCIAVPGFGGHSYSAWHAGGQSIRYQVSHADTSREIDSQKRGRLNRGTCADHPAGPVRSRLAAVNGPMG